MIKQAPFSFLIVCAVAIGVIWGGSHLYYGHRLEDANQRANNWKSDMEYWKDLATRPPNAQAEAQPSPTEKPVAPATKEHKPSTKKPSQTSNKESASAAEPYLGEPVAVCPPGASVLDVTNLTAEGNGGCGINVSGNVCLISHGQMYLRKNVKGGLCADKNSPAKDSH